MDICHVPTCLVSGGLSWGLTHSSGVQASTQATSPAPAHTLPATVLRFTEGEEGSVAGQPARVLTHRYLAPPGLRGGDRGHQGASVQGLWALGDCDRQVQWRHKQREPAEAPLRGVKLGPG